MSSMVLPCNMGKVVGNDYNPEDQEGQEKRGQGKHGPPRPSGRDGVREVVH